MEEDKIGKEEYIEIEIPYNLYQYLSSEHCDVQNMCRICLSTDNEILYNLMPTKENSILTHMFMAFTNVQLCPNDGLPACICEPCQTQVIHCYDFKIKCEKSDCMLKSILKGEFVTKEELTDHNEAVKEEVIDTNINENNNKREISILNDKDIQLKAETDLVEDVQYLEDYTSENDTLCIVQNKGKKKRNQRNSINTKSNSYLKQVPKQRKIGKKATRNDKSFSCFTCSKIFTKVSTFHAHVKSKHSNIQKPHSCGQCRESFNSENDLKVHSVLHNKGNSWKCNQCSKEFKNRASLRRHAYRHMECKRYPCDVCGKAFSELYALRRHVRVHTGQLVEKKHACDMCDKRYSEAGALAAHVARHAGLRPWPCSTCGKHFPSQRLLASHRLVHSDRKPYACKYCEKRFRHESTRNTHHRTHTGEKPYVCSVCGKNFIQNSNLTLHMRTHTGERPYSCSNCDRKFTSSSSLKTHERIHSGERPYSCNICGKRFARKNLSAHMRQHTGERPFECNVCHKKFSNASRLREHQRVHTGEKPFDCTMCSQKFATKSQSFKHMKSHQKSKKKKSEHRGLVIVQQVDRVPVITDRIMFNKEHGELIRVNENIPTVESHKNEPKELTLNIVQEVPLEVTGEIVLQEDSNMKGDLLVVDNSQNNFQTDNICLNGTNNVNIIDDNINYAGDMNLVTVNEGGVSISSSNLEGTTVKLYQLDQSLVQIHSAGGQVTISKITSKMTANF